MGRAKAVVAFQNIGLISSLTSLGDGRGLFGSGFAEEHMATGVGMAAPRILLLMLSHPSFSALLLASLSTYPSKGFPNKL